VGSGPEDVCRRSGTAPRIHVLEFGSASRLGKVNTGNRVPMWLGVTHVTNYARRGGGLREIEIESE